MEWILYILGNPYLLNQLFNSSWKTKKVNWNEIQGFFYSDMGKLNKFIFDKFNVVRPTFFSLHSLGTNDNNVSKYCTHSINRLIGTPRETQPFEKMSQLWNHLGDLKTVFSDCSGKNKKFAEISKKWTSHLFRIERQNWTLSFLKNDWFG